MDEAVASKKTLNKENLAALGAERLAELLIEVSTSNAGVKRRIRLELAGAQSPTDVAKEIRKRLAVIARSRSFVDWQNRKGLADDLETQRRAIMHQVATADPSEGLELIWRLMALANSVFARCDDSSGTVISIFHGACRNLGELAQMAKVSPQELAVQTFNALLDNEYGQYDDLISVLSPMLGSTGLDQLREQFVDLSKSPRERPNDGERKVVAWGGGGPLYADEVAERHRNSVIRIALQEIADAQGDVDAFIAQQSENARKVPKVAAEIAQRLLKAGRAKEAWTAINAIDDRDAGWIPCEWQEVRLDVMEALGRKEEAQAFRWQCFERSLDSSHLRAYLGRLPPFEDIEAEERALAAAFGFSEVHRALAFLVSWPRLEKASGLVLARAKELNGDHYEILSPAADALAGKHPLAATLILRAMIDFALKHNRVKRYRHAARHLAECESLAPTIGDFGSFESHEHYTDRLKGEHARKTSFWALAK
jgi:hypothetical protein